VICRVTFPPPLTEADMVPAARVSWWRWSSKTGEWTRHVRPNEAARFGPNAKRGGR
jgi:hypothetical protein